MLRTPEREPVAVGVKETKTEQLLDAVRELEHVVVLLKSEGFAPVKDIDMPVKVEAVPLLSVNVKGLSELVLPIVVVAKT